MRLLPRPFPRRHLAGTLAVFALLCLSAAAQAAPVVGFVEHFPGTSLQGWDGGAVESNPGSGGKGGVGDGFLRISTPNGFQHNLGVRSSGAQYTGDWLAAGIEQVRLWLNDVGADDPLEIHFSIGTFTNLWQYDAAFLPPHQEWAEFVVDLTSSAGWTRIIGSGTFTQALQGAQVVHLRHDLAPFMQAPDELDGDVGIDRILLSNGLLDVRPGGPAAPRALQLAAPAPNPSRGDVALALELFEAGPVRIEVVDAMGRLVRRAMLVSEGPGRRVWTWDGRDDGGRAMAAGHYRVRASGPSGGMSRALVRIE